MMYTCKECGAVVKVQNGEVVRACSHLTSNIVADISATTYGSSSMKGDNSNLQIFKSLLQKLVNLLK